MLPGGRGMLPGSSGGINAPTALAAPDGSQVAQTHSRGDFVGGDNAGSLWTKKMCVPPLPPPGAA